MYYVGLRGTWTAVSVTNLPVYLGSDPMGLPLSHVRTGHVARMKCVIRLMPDTESTRCDYI